MIGNTKSTILWLIQAIYEENDKCIMESIKMLVNGLKDSKNKAYKINEFNEKRTLNQNAYCWELIQQIANITKVSKEEVYLDMLKNYGQSTIVSLKSDIPYKNYFKYCEEIGSGEVNGQEFKHIKIYKGSSEFDKKEMQIFLDGIIQECENLGIHTLKGE